ncbi:unnamed protein product [Ambrosiozyma monospora]|uniref:Unnamed protein product n=1 Tax=Ambrosiozyma monospora TaxID=43982 RepID=A0ACB5SWT6_AMBMO|nr:unnamed protein product [Ambrosiozyma monospora]
MSEIRQFLRRHLIAGPRPTRLSVLDFSSLAAFNKIQTTSDELLGGFSTAHFEPYRIKPMPKTTSTSTETTTGSGLASDLKLVGHFHGNLNTALPPSNPKVKSSGWCMMKTKNRQKDPGYQYKPFYWSLKYTNTWWDFSPFTVLYLKVCNLTPKRKFMVNIQTDTMSRTDLYQHRLFTSPPITLNSDSITDSDSNVTAPVWDHVFIQLNEFVLTNRRHRASSTSE